MTHASPKRVSAPGGPNPDSRWTDMPCPLCDANEMWCWTAPGTRAADCTCLACAGTMTFEEWTRAQGFTSADLVALAGLSADAEG